MAKKNVSEMESMHGIYQGFFTNLWDLVREKAVPFAAIYRLANAGGRSTLGKMIDMAHTDWLAEQPKQTGPQGGHPYRAAPTNGEALPENHYRVGVTYAPMPSIDDLKKEWGKNNVSDIFDGRPFSFHSSCVGMDRTPREQVFYLHDAGGDWEGEEQITWGEKQRSAIAPIGYRPATHEENHEFAKAHPELVDFVGLGSFAMRGDRRYVALVWQDAGQRILGYDWFGSRWARGTRVLFVSK